MTVVFFYSLLPHFLFFFFLLMQFLLVFFFIPFPFLYHPPLTIGIVFREEYNQASILWELATCILMFFFFSFFRLRWPGIHVFLTSVQCSLTWDLDWQKCVGQSPCYYSQNQIMEPLCACVRLCRCSESVTNWNYFLFYIRVVKLCQRRKCICEGEITAIWSDLAKILIWCNCVLKIPLRKR